MKFDPEERRQYVGASEVGILFGVCPWKTLYTLWHEKRGSLEPEDISGKDAVFWGTVLQPAIADGFARSYGVPVQELETTIRHPEVNGLAATPDCEVLEIPAVALNAGVPEDAGPGLAEIKTVDKMVFLKDWPEQEPPLHYELQLQTQLECTRKRWGLLVVLVGGNRLEVFVRMRRPKTVAAIKRRTREFWKSIEANEEPSPDYELDAGTISRLYMEVTEDKAVDFTGHRRLPKLCAEYEALGVTERDTKRRRQGVRAKILEILEDAAVATTDGWRVRSTLVPETEVTSTRREHRRLKVDDISEKQEEAA